MEKKKVEEEKEIDFDKILCHRTLKKFIEKKDDKERLILSKIKIAEYFGVSRESLYYWLKKNGYDNFINTKIDGKPYEKIDLSEEEDTGNNIFGSK